MSIEKIDVFPYYRGVRALLKLAEGRRANYLRLLGPASEKVMAIDFLSVYPPRLPTRCPRIVPLLGIPKKYIAPTYEFVLNLDLPKRATLDFKGDNPLFRIELEAELAVNLVPSILLTLGTTVKGERAADLFFLPGISPQTALAELKQAVHFEQSLIAKRN